MPATTMTNEERMTHILSAYAKVREATQDEGGSVDLLVRGLTYELALIASAQKEPEKALEESVRVLRVLFRELCTGGRPS